MHDSDFENGDDSDDDVYSRRRSRKSKQRAHMSRMERRTALSLRPISQKCYTEVINGSPIHYSDSEGRRGGVRRSKRKQVQFNNSSWLTDDQMPKVGYPTLGVGYSEEDSRDGPEAQWQSSGANRRSTRHTNRREIKNPKYLYDYQTNQTSGRRHRVENRELKSIINDKDNRERNLLNGTRNGKQVTAEKPANTEGEPERSEANDSKNLDENTENVEPLPEPKPQQPSSESEDEVIPKSRPRNRSNRMIVDEQFSPIRTRKKKMIDSSSESEGEEKKYSLRNRVPKPDPKTIQNSVLRSRTRRHFTRRRKMSGSSSSSSSSSTDVRHSKPPKSPHSKTKAGSFLNIVPIAPEILDNNIRFSSIGGLETHIQCLKEMILMPMMYPEVFSQFQIQPPKGVLFHGPPGTGKTLIARALANECNSGKKKMAFFVRKGADLLSKWVGESEKQLMMLFQQAADLKPSIIFFDELDGLAPVRSSRQDQHHASIVSTLLALMDGLDSRGEVIVIGATNRIDAIDPALRRPGRFDRELVFSLPSKEEREEILKVHVSKWATPPSPQMLSYLAEQSVGYCGADLRALCAEAVIQSFRRTYPQVYGSEHKLMLNPDAVKIEKLDFLRAKSVLVPASHRQKQTLGKRLSPVLQPLLQAPLMKALKILAKSFPHGSNTALAKVKLSPNVLPAQFLITGNGANHGQTRHLAPAILYEMEHIRSYLMDLSTLHQETGRSAEETCIQIFNEARRNIPSIIYLPIINQWWELVSDSVKAILRMQLTGLEANIPLLFMATSELPYEHLPDEIQDIFSVYREEVFHLEPPSLAERTAFFKPLIQEAMRPPRTYRPRPKTPPPLPRAPTPPPPPLTEEQAKKLYETEEHTLRELRIFLRDICKKLANNRLFFMFTKPVDTEQVSDYTTIIKKPMDLETMMNKVDFHRYECAKDFLDDIELIVQNALEYNPARTSADKQIRHRACSLRDYAYTLIKSEMDTDFEEKCRGISKKRRERKASTQKYLPAYLNTIGVNLSETPPQPPQEEQVETKKEEEEVATATESSSPQNKMNLPRKRKYSWQKGCLTRRKRYKHNTTQEDTIEKASTGDESKENNPQLEQSNSNVSLKPVEDETATTPLTINCDTQAPKQDVANSLQSPKRRLSDILSPSELLDSPLDFDDIDQVLNESVDGDTDKPKKCVECSSTELEKVLEEMVQSTMNYSLKALFDLYNNVNMIIKKYSRTYERNSLPVEIKQELEKFIKSTAADLYELSDS
ncbi:ATPase family AAA domain-containing protein 2 isoform X2 [Aethina tumida]|nr:ATPase family AAA domain-containing protein 2 isoform X2 [Aethina tumida]